MTSPRSILVDPMEYLELCSSPWLLTPDMYPDGATFDLDEMGRWLPEWRRPDQPMDPDDLPRLIFQDGFPVRLFLTEDPPM